MRMGFGLENKMSGETGIEAESYEVWGSCEEIQEVVERNEQSESTSITAEGVKLDFETCAIEAVEAAEPKPEVIEEELDFEACAIESVAVEEVEPEVIEEELDFEVCAIAVGFVEEVKADTSERALSEASRGEQLETEVEKEPLGVAELLEEQKSLEQRLGYKFEELLAMDRGTEAFEHALQEYNEMKDRKALIDEKVCELNGSSNVWLEEFEVEETEEVVDKEARLREEQIEEGERIANIVPATISGAELIEQRFEEHYSDNKNDKAIWESQKRESSELIDELSDQKAKLELAMDARMQEIFEYVTEHNYTQYEASQDSTYRQLTEEYNRVRTLHEKVKYHMAVLDENNILMARKLGEEYVPIRECVQSKLIEEVAEGRDNPSETDYFTDEQKAKEVLLDFKQEEWEKLTVEERKQSVERLADYTSEILGLKEKPTIKYYYNQDNGDFGGYSPYKNEISINEYNMNDAVETADTITHESRHRYQHERAQKLENERDHDFKEGFKNYIRPNDDYQGYKEQLVEADAREFASAIKNKIDEYAESQEAQTITMAKALDLTRRINGRDITYKSFSELVRRSECYEYACSREKFEKLDSDEIERIVNMMLSKSRVIM